MNPLIMPAVAGLAIAVLLMVVFLVARDVFGRRPVPPDPDGEEPIGILVPEPEAKTAGERLDQGFDRLVSRTGTGMTTVQAAAVVLLCVVLLGGLPLLFNPDPVVAFLGVLAGVALPLAVFAAYRARYQRALQEQLPDAVFLMSRSVRAGLTIEQAIQTAGQHGPQPLAREFRRTHDQIELGLSVPAALAAMARRVDLIDFRALVTAVSLHRNLGGNLALLLERVAQATRDRNQFRGYFRAATALGRITGIAIALVPIGLLFGYAVWQPDFIGRFTSTAMGLRFLVTAAVLEIVGAIWLWFILRIDY